MFGTVTSLVLSASGVAAASATASCPPPSGARVLARSSHAVVWDNDLTVKGCLSNHHRAIDLAPSTGFDTEHASLAGPFAAVSIDYCDKETGFCGDSVISVTDLRDGRRITRRSYGEGDDVPADVEDLKVTLRGALVALLAVGANREVWLLCPQHVKRYAAAPNIGPRLVRRRGTIWWTDLNNRTLAGVKPTCH
jgi:hypothetical protein